MAQGNSSIVPFPKSSDESETSKKIFRVQQINGVELHSLGELIESKEIGDEVIRRAKNITERYGFSTGYDALDEMLRGGGLLPGLLYVVSGRPGMGKTTFGLNLAYNVAEQGLPVVVFSLELTNLRLVERLAYSQAGINYMEHYVTKTPLDGSELERLRATMARLQSLPLYAKDTTGMNSNMITQTMQAYKEQLDLKVMVIDYLHIMRPDDTWNRNREREIGLMVERVRDAAKTLNVSCILLCQLNREVEDSPPFIPTLKHLRDSGAIEQVAYSVWALYRKDYYVQLGLMPPDDESGDGIITLDSVMNVALLKQQDGPIGTIALHYEAGTGKVSNWQ